MADSTVALTCPKCGGEMRNYERNGVHIDQCAECRGIFLDRGELDRLVDAEASFNATRQPQLRQSPAPVYSPEAYDQPYRDDRHRDDRHRDDRHRDDRQHGGGYRKKKRGSFFEELFD